LVIGVKDNYEAVLRFSADVISEILCEQLRQEMKDLCRLA
jgi:hypothetical protein